MLPAPVIIFFRNFFPLFSFLVYFGFHVFGLPPCKYAAFPPQLAKRTYFPASLPSRQPSCIWKFINT